MRFFKIFTMLIVFMLIATLVTAATVTLRWERNNEPDLAKYTAFWRAPGDVYVRNAEAPFFHEDVAVLVVNSTDDIQHPRQITIKVDGNEWEFVVTATDDTGNESGYSNQVDIIKPQPPENLSVWEVIYAFIKKIVSWFFA